MSVDLTVDLSLYPIGAVMGAAYVFVDRCYVFLDKPAEGKVQVSLTGKPGSTEDDLHAISGEFQNELLSQALRHEIGLRHERLRELLMARALFGAAPELAEEGKGERGAEQASGDVLSGDLAASGDTDPAEREDDQYLDDPLGIAIPWEEKYDAAAAKAGKPGTAAPAKEAVVPAGSGGPHGEKGS